MKTNKLPQSEWSGSQAAGSQSHQNNQAQTRYLSSDADEQTDQASNDADYAHDLKADISRSYTRDNQATTMNHKRAANHPTIDSGYKKASFVSAGELTALSEKTAQPEHIDEPYAEARLRQSIADKPAVNKNTAQRSRRRNAQISPSFPEREISERVFMNTLIKHTAIALAIIIPLAAFSAYAAPMPAMTMSADNSEKNSHTAADTLAVTPSDIIHNTASEPTTVDSVDLEQYAGTWYEIGRLPMYFQRNCARDVTATYTPQTDGSGIDVLNQCVGEDGKSIAADGVANMADDSGSKLKVTFLPSWLRWLPVGRANYWVLARDDQYNTALVGTPDHKYLWLLARTPDIRQDTYAKYRQIAQQQGYDLKEFNLTVQTDQTVKLVP